MYLHYFDYRKYKVILLSTNKNYRFSKFNNFENGFPLSHYLLDIYFKNFIFAIYFY